MRFLPIANTGFILLVCIWKVYQAWYYYDYKYRSIQGNYSNPYYDISKTPEENRANGGIDLSYGECFYLSEAMPRAWVFTAEQILLKASMGYRQKKSCLMQ